MRTVLSAGLLGALLMLTAGTRGDSDVVLTAREVVARVAPAVVQIEVEDAAGTRLGSGILLAEYGSVVTALHVVDGARRIGIALQDGTRLDDIAVRSFDVEADLAVLLVEDRALRTVIENVDAIEFGDPAAIVPGVKILVMGSPLGLEQTVTEGIVSAWREPEGPKRTAQRRSPGSRPLLLFCRMLQISAAVAPGSSGGPVLDERGRLIGIATSGMGGGMASLNFAVPIERLRPLLERDDALDLLSFRRRVDDDRLDLARPYFDKAQTAYERGERPTAERQLELAMLAFPRYGDALLLSGRMAREEGRNDVAQQRFQKAVDSNPQSAESWFALGEVLHQSAIDQDDAAVLSRAEQCYDRALAIDSWHAAAAYHLALIVAGRGDLDRAEELLLAAIDSDPYIVDAHAILGEIYLARDRFNDARDAFEQALWQNENHVRSHFGIARLYTVTEQSSFGTVTPHGRAEHHWGEFLRLSKGDPSHAAEREIAVGIVRRYFPHLLNR